MKKSICLFTLVFCFALSVSGATQDFINSLNAKDLGWNVSSFDSNNFNDLCDQAPPPNPTANEAVMTPSCIDISDGNSSSVQTVIGDGDSPINGNGNQHKGLIYIEQNPFVKVYKEIEWSPGTYTFIEESALQANQIILDETGFIASTPNVDLNSNDIVTYRFEVVHRTGGTDTIVMHGRVKVFYPGFWEDF